MAKSTNIFKEFMEFLKEYKVIGLAIAFIMALAANTLIKSLVDNIIMPIITPFIPGGGWEASVLNIGPIALKWGAFLSSLIYFVLLAWAVFIIAKYALREEKVSKK
jgi:large conductance mechanosensitive channel